MEKILRKQASKQASLTSAASVAAFQVGRGFGRFREPGDETLG
jgi:hypothetical protein